MRRFLLLPLGLLLPLAVARAQAAPQLVVADTYHRTVSARHPVLKRIKPGEVIATKTVCTGGVDENGIKRSERGNPLTGPFYIEGAEPGDGLVVRFNQVRMNRSWGFTTYRLGLFSLTPEGITTLYPDRYKPDHVFPGRANLLRWEIDRERQTVRLSEPASAVIKLEFPAVPMLGCVAVAPEGDFAPTTAPAGSYGGNLDYNRIGAGATVMLPVYHPGALFFIGDGHALQADGEPTGTGIETSMDVEFVIEIRKDAKWTGPRVEIDDSIISLGSQPEFVSSLDRSIRMATSDMVSWLVDDYKLEPWAAHMLIGYQGRYEVVTVAGTMALRIPKKYLPVRAHPRLGAAGGL